MSPVFDLGSLRRSPLVNRVRSVYRNNVSDSALESLRMESVNLSHIRDLSTGFKSSSSDSSESSFQRINFCHRKRFNECVLQRSRSRSNESLKLERNNTFSDEGKRKNCGEDSLKSSIHEFESPLDSDYKTPNMSPEQLSPLNFLLNYRSLSDKSEDYKDALSFGSRMSLVSDYMSPQKTHDKSSIKYEDHKDTFLMDAHSDVKNDLGVRYVKKDVDGIKGPKSIDECTEGVDWLSYSFERSCYVFRIVFEPKLSTSKNTNLVPSRIIVNKTPFLIGSDPTCDLVLSKKYKFIASRHCKITFHSPSASETSYVTATTSEVNSPIRSQVNSSYASPRSTSDSSPCSVSRVKVKTEDVTETSYSSSSKLGDIVPFRVKICRCSPSGVVYVNNSLLRGSEYLENGDLISLGSRNSNITFRVVFQSKKDCQLLKSQLMTPATLSIDTQSSEYLSLNSAEESDRERSLSYGSHPENDDRIVLFQDINITGVKIFVFQVFNYNVDSSYSQECEEESEGEYLDYLTDNDNQLDYVDGVKKEGLFEDQELDKCVSNEHGDGMPRQLGENEPQEKSGEYETQQGMENTGLSQTTETEDYYRLKSPIRNYRVLKSPVKGDSRDAQVKSLESFKTDALIEVYSGSERMSSALSNCDMTQDSNYDMDQFDSQGSTYESQYIVTESQGHMSVSQDTEGLSEEKYMDKVKFLKSIIPNNFPIAIEANNSVSGSTTPRSGKTHYKLIGTVDASNNMNISEILPMIDELVRTNIDESLVNFQVVLKKFNTPVKREMLENSWVFQLEFLDVGSPKIRRAIFKHKMFREDQQELEKVLKENKCRVMYIKTD